jgi:hypothetical protein
LQALTRGSGLSRLYVHAADSNEPVEIREYVAGLPETGYWVEGPRLHLVVSFPRPRFTGVKQWTAAEATRHWTGVLQNLPVRHAVLRLAGGEPGVIRVASVLTPTVNSRQREQFLAKSIAANCQPAAEINATLEYRQQQVERLAAGGSIQSQEEGDDGSLV